jgi:hypothetical protein
MPEALLKQYYNIKTTYYSNRHSGVSGAIAPVQATQSHMSLITSQQKKKSSQKRKQPDDTTGKLSNEVEEGQKKSQKKKKEEPKKKLPPLVKGMSFQAGHRIFGWHTNKFTNKKTLRPCEVIQRSPDGTFPVSREDVNSINNNNSETNGSGSTTTASSSATTTTTASTASSVSASSSVATSSSSTSFAASSPGLSEPSTTTTTNVIYKYYVHFLELNRRNDCWLKRNLLCIQDNEGKYAPTDRNVGANSAFQVSGRENVEFIEEAGHDKNEGMDEQSLREHEEVTKIKNVEMIELGKHKMDTWYFSPYPSELFPNNKQQNPIDVLYICEFTLHFFKYKDELRRHYNKNPIRHPPGNEIYRDKNAKLSMFEVDGADQQIYCQNLCWLGKLFLDHKTLYYDVDPFMFYILCEFDERGYHIVGFYSKEKLSDMGYNLACILTLPA